MKKKMEKIIIDYREHKLIELLSGSEGIPFEKANLTLGDIHIFYPEDKEIVIERKTWGDLWSSIKDGRYREQRSRLTEWQSDTRWVIYMLEGCPTDCDRLDDEKNKEICICTLHRLGLLYHMAVWKTEGLSESAQYIIWLTRQKTLFKKSDSQNNQIAGLATSMVKKKRDVQNPRFFLIATLQSISGITTDLAKQIVGDCASVVEFVTALRDTLQEDFSKKPLVLKNGTTTRKLGKEKTKKIYELFGVCST